MLVFENKVTIEKPLDDVFSFVSDQRNNPKWNYFVLRVEHSNDLLGVGAEYLQVRKSDQQKVHIVDFEENRRLVIQTLPGERPSVKRELRFSGDGVNTTIHDRVELLVPLPMFLSRILTAKPRQAVRHNLECLKTLLECGHVVLKDGRTVNYSAPILST